MTEVSEINISLQEMKMFLRVDGNEEDDLIEHIMETAEKLSLNVARNDGETDSESPNFRMAVLYATAYLYEHREEADHNALLCSLRSLLMGERKAAF